MDADPTPSTPRQRIDTADHPLTDLADVILRVAREIDPHGRRAVAEVVPLNATEATIMRWVHHHPGVSPSETADATGLRRSNLSAGLRGLESKGMVRREPDPADARAVRLFATDLAARSIAILNQHWQRQLAAVLDVDHDPVQETAALLHKLAVGLNRHLPHEPEL